MKLKMLCKDAKLAKMKILLCEPLVRRDCAAAQSFYVGYVVNERGKEDMKQKQKSFGKRLLSMFLTAVLLLSGITVPVQADNSQGEAASLQKKSHTSILNMTMAEHRKWTKIIPLH